MKQWEDHKELSEEVGRSGCRRTNQNYPDDSTWNKSLDQHSGDNQFLFWYHWLLPDTRYGHINANANSNNKKIFEPMKI